MKFLIVVFAFVCCAYADVSKLGYHYEEPVAPAPFPVQIDISYIPSVPAPVSTLVPPPPSQPAPINTYIPPAPSAPIVNIPINSYIPPAPVAPQQPIEVIEQIPEDGYHYKTVHRA